MKCCMLHSVCVYLHRKIEVSALYGMIMDYLLKFSLKRRHIHEISQQPKLLKRLSSLLSFYFYQCQMIADSL